MLVTLVIVLLVIGAAIVGSIYSGFLVFYSNFSESENYHRAYYTSISALERGELVSKQRDPGYIGNGGFILGEGTGTWEDGGSDSTLSRFSYLSDNLDSSTIFRNINSRQSGRIPATGKGNIEYMLAYESSGHPEESSYNYNIMDYENAEIFLLYYDNHGDNPYIKISCRSGTSWTDKCTQTKPTNIEGKIRLPKLLSGFGLLDTGNQSVISKAGEYVPSDDSIVDWQIKGSYKRYPFTIFSTQEFENVNNKVKVNYEKDTVFRESYINGPLTFQFGNGWNPLSSTHSTEVVIISEKESNIKDKGSFRNIFNDDDFKIQIRFSLLNLLKGTYNIYPYLEYYIDFGDGNVVPDKYYTIDAEGNYADYQVKTIIQKPTIKESVLKNFTTIF